jgi:uncharacterized protein YyaL (SSP411 family)
MDQILNGIDPTMLAKLPPDGGTEFNRLIFEKSPYLLQHARNPVDWYAWGEEAFQAALEQDKPVFLSIGYSTCHWCHVMEKESFEDNQVARLLNDVFISIKVDREERPDIDQIYMSVCQAVTGMGGWPLTVVLTPDRKPFFAGTYFPKQSRYGRTGMLDLIPKISQLWQDRREELLESADSITNHLAELNTTSAGELQHEVFQAAFDQLNARYDALYGGFGPPPKFPSPHNLLFLIRFWHKTKGSRPLEIVEKTLTRMRMGGIFDQVGFGFHRYSTDESWLLPHFEKMLYDQALMILAYTETFQATGDPFYRRVTKELITYVIRDMKSPDGGFYSAEDADSEGEEGLFYLWKLDEFNEVLGEEQGGLFSQILNLKADGNYYDEATKAKTGRNILYLKKDLSDHAREQDHPANDLHKSWEENRQKLFETRKNRIRPLKDDKILTDWNGLMIAALAKAGAVLGENEYVTTAKESVDFIWEHLRDNRGRLIKRFRDGEASQPSHLDDYAFLIWGLIELYQADFNPVHLKRALELNTIMLEDYWDEQNGGLFLSSAELNDLIVRSKEVYDGAIPSGNSVAAHNLIRLSRYLSDPELETKSAQIAETFANLVNPLPQGFTHLLSSVLFAVGPTSEIVITGDSKSTDTQDMIRIIQKSYLPHAVLIFAPSDQPDSEIYSIIPQLKNQPPIDGKATVYICRNFTCQAPVTDPEVVREQLKQE